MSVPLLLVTASCSDSGKTTLIERLIPALAALGVRVAAIKRSHHLVDPDTPGKDSRRFRDAGAVTTVLATPGLVTAFHPTERAGPDDLARIATAGAAADLVLIEGFRDETNLPRVEVVAPGAAPLGVGSPLVAVAGAEVAGVPSFARDDVAGLAACVAAWLVDDDRT